MSRNSDLDLLDLSIYNQSNKQYFYEYFRRLGSERGGVGGIACVFVEEIVLSKLIWIGASGIVVVSKPRGKLEIFLFPLSTAAFTPPKIRFSDPLRLLKPGLAQ
jgi:hypothetical protein